jgi:hypothetical protein
MTQTFSPLTPDFSISRAYLTSTTNAPRATRLTDSTPTPDSSCTRPPHRVTTTHSYLKPSQDSLEAWISQADPSILRCISDANSNHVQGNTIDNYSPHKRDG